MMMPLSPTMAMDGAATIHTAMTGGTQRRAERGRMTMADASTEKAKQKIYRIINELHKANKETKAPPPPKKTPTQKGN